MAAGEVSLANTNYTTTVAGRVGYGDLTGNPTSVEVGWEEYNGNSKLKIKRFGGGGMATAKKSELDEFLAGAGGTDNEDFDSFEASEDIPF